MQSWAQQSEIKKQNQKKLGRRQSERRVRREAAETRGLGGSSVEAIPLITHLHTIHLHHHPPWDRPHTIPPTPSPTLHHHHTSAPTPSDPSKDLGKLSPVGHAQPPRGSLESRLPSESLVSHRVQRLQGGGNAGSPRLGGCRWVEHGMHCALPPPTAPPGGRHALHRTPASNPEGPGLAWPRALWGLG